MSEPLAGVCVLGLVVGSLAVLVLGLLALARNRPLQVSLTRGGFSLTVGQQRGRRR